MIKFILLAFLLLIALFLILKNRKRCKNCVFFISDDFKRSVGKCVFNRRKQKIICSHEKCDKFSKEPQYKKWFFFLFFLSFFLSHSNNTETIVYVPERKAYVEISLRNKEYSKQFKDIKHYKSRENERIYIQTLENIQYRNYRMINYEEINVKVYKLNGQLGFKPEFKRTINGKKFNLGGDYYIYQNDNPYHFWNFLNNDSNFNNHQFLFDIYHTDMLNQINPMEGCLYVEKEVIDDYMVLKFYSDYEINQWNDGFLCEMIIKRS